MNRKFIALLLLICFTLSCFGFTAVASSIPDKIDGPAAVLKPMDGSVTKVKYTLLDDEGELIDDSLINWSASNGLTISEDGYIFLSENIENGTYTINAEVGGISAPAKTITVKSGGYLPDTYTSGTINMLSSGFHGDCNFEFDFTAASASNSAAFFLKLLERDSNWHFPVYLRSHATNYKLRFDNYSGTDGGNKRDEYTTSYAYGTTQTIRVKFNYDEANDYISSYSVYLNGSLIDLFDNCIVMSKGSLNYQGIRELSIRNTISMKNIKVYSGEKVDSNDPEYKYTGVVLSGEDTLSAPRKNEYLTSQYDVENIFGVSLNNEASWSVSPAENGVTVDSTGLVSVARNAVGGSYTISATVDGVDYSKVVEVSSVEYKLVINGRQEYIRDFTHIYNQLGSYSGGGHMNANIVENYTATDQLGEPVKVSWSLEGAPVFSYTFSQISDNVGRLSIPSEFPDGTYTLKATADPSEGIDDPIATLTIAVKPAAYEIVGPDTIVVSDGTCNAVKYELMSSLGNTFTDRLNWHSDNACILPDGNLISSSELPASVVISLNTRLGTYTKNINITTSGAATGTSLSGSLEYTGSDKFPLQDGVNEKILSADLVAGNGIGRVDESDLDIEWTIVGITGYSDGSVPDAVINGSKLIVNGKCSGVITVQGKLKYTPIETPEIEINLTDAFAAITGSVLTLKGETNETFTIDHYKPLSTNFVDGVFGTEVYPDNSSAQIASNNTSVDVNLDLSKPGMHRVVIVNSSYDVNECTIMVDDDKLFYQADVKNLLTNNRINEYLDIYSVADISLIEECSAKYSSLTSEQKDAVLLLTNKSFSDYFVSVKLIDFLASTSTETDSIKSAMADRGLNSAWIDVLKSDVNRAAISRNVISSATNLETLADTVVLQAVKNASVSNPKEVKPYLALCNSNKYNTANDTQKNLIARDVAGKTYTNMEQLLTAINSVNISQNIQGGNGSSSGGKTQTGSIGGYTPPVPSDQNPIVPDVSTNGYNDVTDEHWAYSYINALSEKGIINGMNGNVFMPEANVTRAEFVKMLVEAFSISKSQNAPFTDVNASEWYSPYIAGAYDAGLIMGDGQSFRPNDQITRQDAAVMIYRFSKYFNYDFDVYGILFTDSGMISEYAVESVNALSSASIINGLPDGSFAPLSSATRAEAAKMIYGILEKGGIR